MEHDDVHPGSPPLGNPLDEEFRFHLPPEDWLNEVRGATTIAPLAILGGYELLEEVGRGGQGVIYRANRLGSGEAVAVKRLRGESLSSPAARHRFDREFEAAAELDHPAIVRVFDRSQENGSTHFAMPWIDGVPITRWARPDEAPPRPALDMVRLMRDVCAAVHHAHQRGVIHRDLKPGNILVDAAGRPHILDFGLAKRAGEAPAPARGLDLTQTGDFVGTLAYASPEQLRGEVRAIDLRSDVYALGMILYEMVAGRLPQERARGRGQAALDADLSSPSRPSHFNREARGDLDAIVLKAIAPEPERRYQSADALAGDLDRFLRHEPVLARPPHALYLLRKSIRRHPVRWGIGLTALLFIIAAGIAATFAAAYLADARAQESAARLDERDARLIAEQMNEFLTTIFTSADPLRAAGANLTAREVLDAASARLAGEFQDAPQVRANLHNALAASYLSLGMYDEAEAHLTAADDLLKDAIEPAGPLEGDVASNLAALRYEQGRHPEAEQFARRALDLHRRLLGVEHPDTAKAKNNLGAILRALGRPNEAKPLYEEALRTRRALLGPDHPDVAETLNNLAGLLMLGGDAAGAQPLFEQALDIRRTSLGERHALTAQSMDNLATVLARQGRYEESLPHATAALAILREALDDDHPSIASSASSLGAMLVMMGRSDEAEPLLREALSIRLAAFGPGDRRTCSTRVSYAECLRRLGRLAEAEESYLQAILALNPADATHRPVILSALDGLIQVCEAQGRTDEAAGFRARRAEFSR